MAFFDFVNKFMDDNAAEIKAASEGAAAVWSIGSKLAGIAADMAVDTAKGAYDSLMAEKVTAKSDATTDNNNKALIEELMRQNEELKKRLDKMEAEKAELYSEVCRKEEQEDYDLESWADMQQSEDISAEYEEENLGEEYYRDIMYLEILCILGGTGEAFCIQAMNYIINKYDKTICLPFVEIDREERCLTILRPDNGYTYVYDDHIEEML